MISAVAAEDRAEPGDAGIGIRPFRRLGDQHVEIGDAAAEGLVEDIVRCLQSIAARDDETRRARRASRSADEEKLPARRMRRGL